MNKPPTARAVVKSPRPPRVAFESWKSGVRCRDIAGMLLSDGLYTHKMPNELEETWKLNILSTCWLGPLVNAGWKEKESQQLTALHHFVMK